MIFMVEFLRNKTRRHVHEAVIGLTGPSEPGTTLHIKENIAKGISRTCCAVNGGFYFSS